MTIFISYSRQDQSYVDKLVQAIERQRLPYWIDHKIDYGTTWPREIEENLKRCSVFLLVMSPRSAESHWVNCELTKAIEFKKHIFPLLLESSVWFQVANKQVVDVIGGKLPPDKFFERIRAVLGSEVNVRSSRNQVRQKAVKKPQNPLVEDLGNGITLEMVNIPGGSFLMGSVPGEKDSYDEERPQHRVTIQSFSIGKYPVTQAEWKAIANRLDLKINQDLDPNSALFKDRPDSDRRPVEQVSWNDAIEFCGRLSKLTGQNYRLPSEAEWEYACRAGTTTAYSFGDNINDKLANYNQNIGETTSNSKYSPNISGIYDMHGNVWEWCADYWHNNYENAPTDGRAWLAENSGNSSKRVLRGGSWYADPRNCRSATRNVNYARSRYYHYGFRVVCSVPRASSSRFNPSDLSALQLALVEGSS